MWKLRFQVFNTKSGEFSVFLLHFLMIWSTSSAPWWPYKPPTPTRKASKRRLLSESAVTAWWLVGNKSWCRINWNLKCLRWGSPSNSTTKLKVNEGSHKFISENVWIDRCREKSCKVHGDCCGRKKMVTEKSGESVKVFVWHVLFDKYRFPTDGWESFHCFCLNSAFSKNVIWSVWRLASYTPRAPIPHRTWPSQKRNEPQDVAEKSGSKMWQFVVIDFSFKGILKGTDADFSSRCWATGAHAIVHAIPTCIPRPLYLASKAKRVSCKHVRSYVACVFWWGKLQSHVQIANFSAEKWLEIAPLIMISNKF